MLTLFGLKSANSEEYYMIGMGLKNCGQLIEDYRADEAHARILYAMWISGFLAGTNSVCKKQVKVGWSGPEAYLRQYCHENPLSNVGAGAHKLRAEAGGPNSADDCR
jgi:hypothetical protein